MARMNLKNSPAFLPQRVMDQGSLHVVGCFAHAVAEPPRAFAVRDAARFGRNVDDGFIRSPPKHWEQCRGHAQRSECIDIHDLLHQGKVQG